MFSSGGSIAGASGGGSRSQAPLHTEGRRVGTGLGRGGPLLDESARGEIEVSRKEEIEKRLNDIRNEFVALGISGMTRDHIATLREGEQKLQAFDRLSVEWNALQAEFAARCPRCHALGPLKDHLKKLELATSIEWVCPASL